MILQFQKRPPVRGSVFVDPDRPERVRLFANDRAVIVECATIERGAELYKQAVEDLEGGKYE